MGELINGRTPKEIKSGLRNMLETCADISGVKDTICREMCCSYDGDNCCHETILMSALALIERLESERDAALAKVPKWIGVEEQPPEFPCLYWDGINQIGITKSLATITLKSGKKVYLSDMFLRAFPDIKQSDVDSCTHILYWMPLPEPPKEGE